MRAVALGIGLLLGSIAYQSSGYGAPPPAVQALQAAEAAATPAPTTQPTAAAADGGGPAAGHSGAAGCTAPGQRLCVGDSVFSCGQDLATAHRELACAGATPNCVDARCVGPICRPPSPSNLLRNPDFDANAEFWARPAGQSAPAWSKTDSTQCTSSGSLRLRARTTVRQCVPIRAGTLEFGGDFLLTPRRREDMPTIEVTLYARANCADGSRAYVAANYTPANDTQWLRARSSWPVTSRVASAEFAVTVPADTQVDKLFLSVQPD